MINYCNHGIQCNMIFNILRESPKNVYCYLLSKSKDEVFSNGIFKINDNIIIYDTNYISQIKLNKSNLQLNLETKISICIKP